MQDSHVQSLTVQDHLEPAQPAQSAHPAVAATSTSLSTAQPHLAPDTVATSHSSGEAIITADTTSPPHPTDETTQKFKSTESDDQIAQVLELLREYAKHDAALPIGVAVAVFATFLKLFSWSQWLIALLSALAGVFGSAYFMFASPESNTMRRSTAIPGFGQRLFQSQDALTLFNSNAATDQLLDTNAASTAAVQSPTAICTKTAIQRYDRVQIASDIDPMVEQMITYFLRDFVNVPVGLLSVGEHNLPLRASLATMFMNLSKKLTGMRLPETPLLGVFGLQNNFIVHLRAYRELRDSRMPIEEYVAKHANRDSVLGRCYSKDERLKQYRSIAKEVCQSLLAKDDQQSAALFAVLQEIMAMHVIGATLDHMCDPDYVNQSIVDYFSEKPAENVAVAAKGNATTQGPENDAAITALADSILTNAASLMGKGKLDPTPDPADTTLSSSGSDSGMQDVHDRDRMTATPSPKPTHAVLGYGPIAQRDSPDTSTAATITRPITLRDVLINRHQHIETYQGFMQYLQVWDAMDLVEFYSMLNLYHRQIHEGVLTAQADIEQEAIRIFNTFCNTNDSDCQVPGLKQANDGALYKNLSKMLRREPATCFHEVQVWAYQTLERQYWQPWQMACAGNASEKTKGELMPSPSGPASSEQNVPAAMRGVGLGIQQQNMIASPELPRRSTSTDPRTTVTNARTATSSPPTRTPSTEGFSAASPSTSSAMCPAPSSSPPPGVLLSQSSIQKTASIASIQLTDLTHERPKMLLSSQDLMYMVEIQAENGHGYMVSRTYQQLEQLHTSLTAHYLQAAQQTAFPRWRLQTSDKVCLGLQTYLQSMLAMPEVRHSPRFAWFLSKEYDQSPDGTFPDDLVQDAVLGGVGGGGSGGPAGEGSASNQLLTGANSVFSSANLSGASNAAAKNAKMAFKQASDASMAVGSFFKSLGGQIGSVIVTDEDRTPTLFRSSSESQHPHHQQHQQQQRSMTFSNGSGNNTSPSPGLRGPPSVRSLARTPSSESVQSMRSFMSHGSTVVDHSLVRPPPPTVAAGAETLASNGSLWNPFSSPNPRRSMTVDDNSSSSSITPPPPRGATVVSHDAPSQHGLYDNVWKDTADAAERQRRGTLDGQELRPSPGVGAGVLGTFQFSDPTRMADPRQQQSQSQHQDDQSDRASIRTLVNSSDQSSDKLYAPPAITAGTTLHATTPPSVSPSPSPSPSQVPAAAVPPTRTAKVEPATLLSGDELDLLIETTFTVLEDMLDFSKGQAIRRMTFGVLRELVRKSYRTAINQSFSGWALENTSHEYAVEMVRWMKDDFFWPNGEWPAAAPETANEDRDEKEGDGGGDQDTQGSKGGEEKKNKTRTEADKLATKEEARQLMRRALPASMVAVLGKDACVRAMTDVFEMFQIRELNLGLAMSVFEMMVRLVLTK
ncbi:hypothetical protein DFQ26_007354 [Actinomortierella ambigua]|nr:hypothetical protein DFQ26_007354 [Actinomortierella ambigua]